MVSGGSVDGLISGLSTSTLISQLMTAEAAPQTALKNKVSAENKAIAAYQSVNTKMASLLTAAADLGKAASWQATKATSSSDAVVATATGTAPSGSFTFTVANLTSSQSVFSYGTAASPAATVASGPVQILLSTGPVPIDVGDGSLQAVVSGINAANAGVRASAVQVAPGQYRLQVSGTKTGADAYFSLDGLDGLGLDPGTGDAFVTSSEAADAKLVVGPPGSSFEILSATNTFSEVMPGVTITAVKPQADVTISVGADADGMAEKVQALMDAANGALAEIAKHATQGTGGVGRGALAGNAALRGLSQQIVAAIGQGAGNLGSFKTVGIELTRDGKLSFDKAAFVTQYAADPARAQAFFDTFTDGATGTAGTFDPGRDKAVGLARRLDTIALVATKGAADDDPETSARGVLETIIDNHNGTLRDLNTRIDGWDTRLENRRHALQRQFTAMETALGTLKNQSTWLSGQIASLPSW
jgi:flagellar hook-associated protein 2